MTALMKFPDGQAVVLARAAPLTQAAPATTQIQKAAKKGEETKKDATGTIPSFTVKPDLSGLPGASTAAQSGINLLGGVVLIALVVFALIAVGRIAAGTGFDMPDHSQGGKKMLLYVVPLAFAASLIGQLVGWGFGLGVVGG